MNVRDLINYLTYYPMDDEVFFICNKDIKENVYCTMRNIKKNSVQEKIEITIEEK